MLLRVNKNTNRRPVKYAAMLSGTVSAVWHDEESASAGVPKRRNRIMVTREKADAVKAAEKFDA